MSFNRTTFTLFAVFWAALIACQYYFLYLKFDAVRVCREQHVRMDQIQTRVDRLAPQTDRKP